MTSQIRDSDRRLLLRPEMMHFFEKLFATDFMPHVFCLRASGLVWLHAVSDGMIAFAYFLIPLALVRLVQRRRDLEFHWLFILFATFILSCGATHVLAIVTLWTPIYRFDALVKIITAGASLLTAGFLIPIVPRIAMLPSPTQWRQANEVLTAEVTQRKDAEASMRLLNAELEHRVEQRTFELEIKNLRLGELTAAWDLAHGVIRDLDGRITFWCKGSEELFGWRKEEAQGRQAFDLLQTEFRTPLSDINNELLAKGSWSGELIHRTKSGARLHIAAHWVLQRGPSGGPVSVIEVNNDITDRLRAEEASQHLADLVESSDDAIISATPEGVITSWNGSAEKLFGYAAAEVIGKPINDLAPAPQTAAEREIVEQARRGKGAKHYQTVRMTKSGQQVNVSLTVSPICNSRGLVIGTSHILHDISEAKAREEAFRLSEERQRLAVEAGQVGLWYLDADGESIWTQRCKELHGLSASSSVPDFPAYLSLIHLEDREIVEKAIRQTLEGVADLSIEYRTRGLDFRTKWVHAKAKPQRDADGTVKGIHGTVIDLTARKEMEEKLHWANIELEQFTYAVAHDLQEPLRNAALASSLLKVSDPVSGLLKQPQLLSTVVESTRRMEAMVKDLLRYLRALDLPDEAPRSDPALVLANVVKKLGALIEQKNGRIVSHPLPTRVDMPESHLLQILQNLIDNALNYAAVAPLQIDIKAEVRAAEVVLSVQDNGIGISPQFHSRAFGMFKRLHGGTPSGTGIGLTVCKRIVEHYGGKIWIKSLEGEGAAFFFTIPIRTALEA